MAELLSFRVSLEGLKKITNYDVSNGLFFQGWVVSSDHIRGQTYMVRNLRPATPYMFMVRAQNSHGLSLPSQISGPFKTAGMRIVIWKYFIKLSWFILPQ